MSGMTPERFIALWADVEALRLRLVKQTPNDEI
jgi:hypothetical protein